MDDKIRGRTVGEIAREVAERFAKDDCLATRCLLDGIPSASATSIAHFATPMPRMDPKFHDLKRTTKVSGATSKSSLK